DLTRVLTEELLQIGRELANETVSLYITTYQAMLPQVFKASYKKELVRNENRPLPKELQSLFIHRNEVTYEDVLANVSSYKKVKALIERGDLSIRYEVKQRDRKKYSVYFKRTNEVKLRDH